MPVYKKNPWPTDRLVYCVVCGDLKPLDEMLIFNPSVVLVNPEKVKHMCKVHLSPATVERLEVILMGIND